MDDPRPIMGEARKKINRAASKALRVSIAKKDAKGMGEVPVAGEA